MCMAKMVSVYKVDRAGPLTMITGIPPMRQNDSSISTFSPTICSISLADASAR